MRWGMVMAWVLILAAGLRAAEPMEPVPLAQVEQAMRLARQYAVTHCEEDGRFTYHLNLDDPAASAPGYNIVRHAGAMWVLIEAQRRWPDEATRATLQRAGRFLHTQCGPISAEQPELIAVWSRPEVNQSKEPVRAKLGGAGLGLAALAGLERLEPGSVPLATLRGLGDFILFMQKPDGSYFSRYMPGQGRDDSWSSLYYPGEAALGLIALYQVDPDPRWLRAAGRTMAFLVRSRLGQADVPPDHWALLATARLLPLYDQADISVPREGLLHHAVQVAAVLQAGQITDTAEPHLTGGFNFRGGTTAAACRMEGLLAVRPALVQASADNAAALDPVIHRGIAFLVQAQVQDGPFAGAVPPAAVPRAADGTPLAPLGEVRIDYVQHVLSAMIQYLDVYGRQTNPAPSAVPPPVFTDEDDPHAGPMLTL